MTVTTRDLDASGIPERALGLVSKALRATLVRCFALNDHARPFMPAALGGTAAGLNAGDDTLSLADAPFARSPAGRKLCGAAAPTSPLAREPSPSRTQLSPSSPTAGASEAAAEACELAAAEALATAACDSSAAPPSRPTGWISATRGLTPAAN